MNTEEYKTRKLEKLTRDVVKATNDMPSLGYGEVTDAMVKLSVTNYLLTLIRLYEHRPVDIEILAQSVLDELIDHTQNLVAEIKRVDNVQ